MKFQKWSNLRAYRSVQAINVRWYKYDGQGFGSTTKQGPIAFPQNDDTVLSPICTLGRESSPFGKLFEATCNTE